MANDAPRESEEKKSRKGLILIILLLAIIVALVVVLVVFVLGGEDEAEDDGPLAYAEGVVVLDPNEPIDVTPPDAMTLWYDETAVSEDGQTFECMIANAAENAYDMYIEIYADGEFTDNLFLSGLISPGTGFEEITLKRSLDVGSHEVYLVFTQVEEDKSTIHNQIIVTYSLVVQ